MKYSVTKILFLGISCLLSYDMYAEDPVSMQQRHDRELGNFDDMTQVQLKLLREQQQKEKNLGVPEHTFTSDSFRRLTDDEMGQLSSDTRKALGNAWHMPDSSYINMNRLREVHVSQKKVLSDKRYEQRKLLLQAQEQEKNPVDIQAPESVPSPENAPLGHVVDWGRRAVNKLTGWMTPSGKQDQIVKEHPKEPVPTHELTEEYLEEHNQPHPSVEQYKPIDTTTTPDFSV